MRKSERLAKKHDKRIAAFQKKARMRGIPWLRNNWQRDPELLRVIRARMKARNAQPIREEDKTLADSIKGRIFIQTNPRTQEHNWCKIVDVARYIVRADVVLVTNAEGTVTSHAGTGFSGEFKFHVHEGGLIDFVDACDFVAKEELDIMQTTCPGAKW
jgi:hypothetical protein